MQFKKIRAPQHKDSVSLRVSVLRPDIFEAHFLAAYNVIKVFPL